MRDSALFLGRSKEVALHLTDRIPHLVIALSIALCGLVCFGAVRTTHSQGSTTVYLPAILGRGAFPTAPPGGSTAQPESTPSSTSQPDPTYTATVIATPDTKLRRMSQSGGTGLCVAATDEHVYVGYGPRVQVYERHDRTGLELVGSTSALSGVVTGIAVRDGIVYAAATSDGVWAIDVSNPRRPALLANVPARDGSESIVVHGDYAYVAEGDTGLRVLDLSDSQKPVEAAIVDTGGSVTNVELSTEQNRLYVMGDDGRYVRCCPDMGHLWIYDISDPASPLELGHLPTLGAYGMAVVGNTVYMNNGFEFLIIDVSEPTQPQEIASLRNLHAVPIAVEGDVMYTQNWGGDHDGLVVVDIRQPESPVPIADVPEARGDAGVVHKGVVFLTGYKAVHAVEAAIPAEPHLAETYPLMYGGWHIHDLGDGLAYVEIGPPVLADISDPSRPTFAELPEDIWLWDDILDVGGRTVVARSIEYRPDVVLLDASDPEHPRQLSVIDLANYAQMAHMTGDRLYLNSAGGLGESMLHVYDVSDPTEPLLLGEHSVGWIVSDLEIEGSLAYAALMPRTGDTSSESPGRLQIIDISDSANLRMLGQVQFAHGAVDVEVRINPSGSRVYAYVVTMDWNQVGGCGLYVVDASEPHRPIIRAFEPTHGPATGITMRGDFIIVSVADVSSRHRWPQFRWKRSGRGLVFDATRWLYPELAQTLMWGGRTIWPHAMANIEGTLWVATLGGGLTAWE